MVAHPNLYSVIDLDNTGSRSFRVCLYIIGPYAVLAMAHQLIRDAPHGSSPILRTSIFTRDLNLVLSVDLER